MILRLLGFVASLALSLIGLGLEWITFPELDLTATGFETLTLANAFILVLGLGVFVVFYFKGLAQRILAGFLALIAGYTVFISANSLLNSSPIIDRLVSVTGAVGQNPEFSFNSLSIAVYFIGLFGFLVVSGFTLIKPVVTKASKRITKNKDDDDPIGIWDDQS